METTLSIRNVESSLQEERTFIFYFPVTPIDTVASILSFTASATFLIVLYLTKSYKHKLHKMVFFLLFADFLHKLSYIITFIHPPTSEVECKIVFAIAFFGRDSSFFWSVLFAYVLLKIVEAQDFSPSTMKMRYFYLIAVYLPLFLSLAMVLSPLVSYNTDNGKCGRYETVGQFDYAYFLISGMPLMFSWLLSIFFYLLTGCRLKILFVGTILKTREALFLVLYPIILIVCWGPNLAWSLISMITKPNSAYLVIPKTCLALHGLLNSLVYGLSPKTRQDIKNLCTRGGQKESFQQTQALISMKEENPYDDKIVV